MRGCEMLRTDNCAITLEYVPDVNKNTIFPSHMII